MSLVICCIDQLYPNLIFEKLSFDLCNYIYKKTYKLMLVHSFAKQNSPFFTFAFSPLFSLSLFFKKCLSPLSHVVKSRIANRQNLHLLLLLGEKMKQKAFGSTIQEGYRINQQSPAIYQHFKSQATRRMIDMLRHYWVKLARISKGPCY